MGTKNTESSIYLTKHNQTPVNNYKWGKAKRFRSLKK